MAVSVTTSRAYRLAVDDFHARFQRRLVLAPDVDDVARAQRRRIEPGERRHPAATAAGAAGAGAELLRGLGGRLAAVEIDQRQQCGPGDPHLRIGLQDLRHRDRDIEVCRLGLLHQRREFRGSEAAPPVERRQGCLGGAPRVPVALGNIDGDIRLVGIEKAAGQGRDQHQNARGAREAPRPSTHAGISPVWSHLTPRHLCNLEPSATGPVPNSTTPPNNRRSLNRRHTRNLPRKSFAWHQCPVGNTRGRPAAAELPEPQAEAIEVEIDHRRRVERQHLAHDQAADDGDAERPAQLAAVAEARSPAAARRTSPRIVVIMIGRKRSRQAS